MMWWPWGASMEWWMIIWLVVFWGGLIALIVWGITRLTRRGDSASKRAPLDIAKDRYAVAHIRDGIH